MSELLKRRLEKAQTGPLVQELAKRFPHETPQTPKSDETSQLIAVARSLSDSRQLLEDAITAIDTRNTLIEVAMTKWVDLIAVKKENAEKERAVLNRLTQKLSEL